MMLTQSLASLVAVYAQELLSQLETNGRPRTAEAELLRSRAADLRATHAEAFPAAGAPRPWLGLEPWFVAACEVDWLDECVARD